MARISSPDDHQDRCVHRLLTTPIPNRTASVAATLTVLFGIGVVKSRWTHRSWWSSGLEILAIGAVAGVAGYFFGSILPIILGAPEAAA